MSNKDTEHLKRLLILIIAIIFIFIIVRSIFVSKDFGRYGYYRGESAEENMSRPQNYADLSLCQACHSEKYSTWNTGRHKTVNCQTCHGALLKHAEDPAAMKPKKPEGRKFCLLCHEANISKPGFFPQIKPGVHNPGVDCAACHNPHQPGDNR